MFEMKIKAASAEEMKEKLMSLLNVLNVIGDTPIYQANHCRFTEEVPPLAEVPKEEQITMFAPVISQEEMQKNVEEAPVHEEPKQPTIEEVRAALKALRDRKGAGAVREILKAYGADSLMDLKPEDYLGARDRALTEV